MACSILGHMHLLWSVSNLLSFDPRDLLVLEACLEIINSRVSVSSALLISNILALVVPSVFMIMVMVTGFASRSSEYSGSSVSSIAIVNLNHHSLSSIFVVYHFNQLLS